MGIKSESECLLRLLSSSIETSDSAAGLKTKKIGGVTSAESEREEVEAELLATERRSLDILSVKK